MKTKKRKMPVLIGSGLACARREQAQQQLWKAVAEAAAKGMVTCPEAPTLDAALYKLTLGCAEVERSADDDLRASMALSEAMLPARGRWRKDGFACGIKRTTGRATGLHQAIVRPIRERDQPPAGHTHYMIAGLAVDAYPSGREDSATRGPVPRLWEEACLTPRDGSL